MTYSKNPSTLFYVMYLSVFLKQQSDHKSEVSYFFSQKTLGLEDVRLLQAQITNKLFSSSRVDE